MSVPYRIRNSKLKSASNVLHASGNFDNLCPASSVKSVSEVLSKNSDLWDEVDRNEDVRNDGYVLVSGKRRRRPPTMGSSEKFSSISGIP
jgi:hypothetical protein